MFYSDYGFIFVFLLSFIFFIHWIKICIFSLSHFSEFLIESISLSIYLLRFYFISISFYRIRFFRIYFIISKFQNLSVLKNKYITILANMILNFKITQTISIRWKCPSIHCPLRLCLRPPNRLRRCRSRRK